jgi:hypothetical protein
LSLIIDVMGVRARSKGFGLAVALVVVSCLVAACGGSSTTKSETASLGPVGGSAQYQNAVKFAKCMRAHGVSNFPDPGPGGFPSGAIAKLNPAAPAFGSASNTCDKLLPNEGQPTQAQFESTVLSAVKVAKCMRAHGAYMPDPSINGNQLTINMSHMAPITPKFTRVGALCDKKVYGYP